MENNSHNKSEKTAAKKTMFAALAAAGGSVAAAVGEKGRNLYDRISAGRRSVAASGDEEEAAFDLTAYKAPIQNAQSTQATARAPESSLQAPKDRSQPE